MILPDAGPALPPSPNRLVESIRTYEKVKLFLLVITVVLDIAIGVGVLYGQEIQRQDLNRNQKSLTLLECAVAKNTQFTPQGRPRTPQDSRVVFDQCVAAARRGK